MGVSARGLPGSPPSIDASGITVRGEKAEIATIKATSLLPSYEWPIRRSATV